MRYELRFADESRGYACVERQGLYYRITCRCELTGEVRFRVHVQGDRGAADLGILIPDGSGFGLRTSIAVKRLGDVLEFALKPVHKTSMGSFVRVSAAEPFAYLTQLKTAVFSRQNGQAGVLLDQKSDSSSPTGQ